ncbi:MAG TPA: glycine--tRNA ligase subunit beta, partial [Casimicrobiaceae bacterium]|nr:glycine--tRNA ligase subunit beta [Casimicrobiaceae bacterium]
MSEPRGETLLVELLSEELPPKALRPLGNAFGTSLVENLRQEGLLTPVSRPIIYATPRRLAVSISAVLARAPDKEVVEKLMPKAVAEAASGEPTAALHGRLKKLGRPHLASGYPDARDGPDH